MLFIQEGTADTLGFMLLGMGVILGLMALYAVNLLLRWRSAREEMHALEELQEQQS